MTLRFILPTTITDARLVSSSVPENDYPAWVSGATYAVGDRRIRAATHSIYERLVAGAGTTPPESDAENWSRVGPTNRWAMFDGAAGTATTATNEITVTVAPGGVVRGLALLDMTADAAVIDVFKNGVNVWSRTFSAASMSGPCDNWWDYYFSAFRKRRILIVTDLPSYYDAQIRVSLTGGGPIKLGMLAVGAYNEIGPPEYGVQTGGTSYSRIVTDDFGVTTIAKRSSVRRMTLSVQIPNSRFDSVADKLEQAKDVPCVWIGHEDYYSLVMYGICKDWYGTLPGPVLSKYNVEITGIISGQA